MPLFSGRISSQTGFEGHFDRWQVLAMKTQMILQVKAKLSQYDLKQMFPEYVQRHANGESWQPNLVGYYVMKAMPTWKCE